MSSNLLTMPTPAETPAAHRPKRRRGSSHTSLSAHGEPMIWLTGGALAFALMMITCLLLHVLWEGFRTFWPGPVVQVELYGDHSYMGEITEVEKFRPSEEAFEQLALSDAEAAVAARANVENDDGFATRRQFRIGNFELTGEHFAWIADFMIQPDSEIRPEWAVLVERLSWGRFYGFPEQFVLTTAVAGSDELSAFESQDGKTIEAVLQDQSTKLLAELSPDEASQVVSVREIWNGSEAAWAQFTEHHDEVRSLWHDRVELQEHALGDLNRQRNDARLNLIEVGLDYGEDSPEYAAAQEQYDAVVSQTTEESSAVEDQIRDLEAQIGRYQLVMNTASGQVQPLSVADIVRAYPANQLGFGQKVGVYLSRWKEFLLDDPREANSEGGVFPAIWGTVAMTMLMSVLVVPFGVLAALYLREYAKAGPIVSMVRIAINNLAGVPSIVFGVFGLGFFCYNVGHFIDVGPSSPWAPPRWWTTAGILVVLLGTVTAVSALTAPAAGTGGRSRAAGWSIAILWFLAAAMLVLLVWKTPYFEGFFRAKYVVDNKATYGTGGLLWASLTLALLTLPVVIVATEEALAAVPGSMREGSYACGASKWQTIRRIVLPRAMPGIMTGMILAMARGAGEVAPLMLVGVLKLAPELPLDTVFPFIHPERSFMHLGFHIYDVGFQSQNSEAAKPMVYTTTLLLIGIIAALNVAAISLRTRLRRRFVSSKF